MANTRFRSAVALGASVALLAGCGGGDGGGSAPGGDGDAVLT